MLNFIRNMIDDFKQFVETSRRDQAKEDLHTLITFKQYDAAKALMEEHKITAKDAVAPDSIRIWDEEATRLPNLVAYDRSLTGDNNMYRFVRANGLSAEDMLKEKLKTYITQEDLSTDRVIEDIEAEIAGVEVDSLHWQAAKKVPETQEDILKPIPELYTMVQSAKFFNHEANAERRDKIDSIRSAESQISDLEFEIETNDSIKRQREDNDEPRNKRPKQK